MPKLTYIMLLLVIGIVAIAPAHAWISFVVSVLQRLHHGDSNGRRSNTLHRLVGANHCFLDGSRVNLYRITRVRCRGFVLCGTCIIIFIFYFLYHFNHFLCGVRTHFDVFLAPTSTRIRRLLSPVLGDYRTADHPTDRLASHHAHGKTDGPAYYGFQ